MSGLNPLSVILNQNKLNGQNYVDWKRNLFIVLTAEDYKYVLTTPCPAQPDERSSQRENETHQKWVKANEMARCYILASISNVLQQQHNGMPNASDMMASLHDMFGQSSRPGRQAAMRALMNTKMTHGTKVRDHVLKMMEHLNEAEIAGAEIDGETQVDIILESLPDSFTQFKLNYNMNKMMMSTTELMNELHNAEQILKKEGSIHLAEGSSSKPKPKGKGGKKKKKALQASKDTAAKKEGKPKGKCFKCGKKGHWKKDCPEFQKKSGNQASM